MSSEEYLSSNNGLLNFISVYICVNLCDNNIMMRSYYNISTKRVFISTVVHTKYCCRTVVKRIANSDYFMLSLSTTTILKLSIGDNSMTTLRFVYNMYK